MEWVRTRRETTTANAWRCGSFLFLLWRFPLLGFGLSSMVRPIRSPIVQQTPAEGVLCDQGPRSDSETRGREFSFSES